MLLFPVIAWYDIIYPMNSTALSELLFPVIAWYDIMCRGDFLVLESLLFPVIAWYDIIGVYFNQHHIRCCSQLSLGMI